MGIFKRNRLKMEVEKLQKENQSLKVIYNYEKGKVADDFNVINQILDLKINMYETIIFDFNRYQEEKKVNVKDDEINENTVKIVASTMETLSEDYVNYLVTKYYSSKEKMIELYTDTVYLRLLKFASTYNTQDLINKKRGT